IERRRRERLLVNRFERRRVLRHVVENRSVREETRASVRKTGARCVIRRRAAFLLDGDIRVRCGRTGERRERVAEVDLDEAERSEGLREVAADLLARLTIEEFHAKGRRRVLRRIHETEVAAERSRLSARAGVAKTGDEDAIESRRRLTLADEVVPRNAGHILTERRLVRRITLPRRN